MADAIHSVTQFYRQLKKRDVFWHITSLHGRPYAVDGPCEIRRIFRERGIPKVEYIRPWVEISESIAEDFVEDLVNELHGVFLNQPDAMAEFDRRSAAYAMELLEDFTEYRTQPLSM